MVTLDETDLKILRILQDNARIPTKAIAEQVYISPPTVAARIDAMRRAGVIKEFATVLNPDAFGSFIKAYIDMEVSPTKRAELYEYLRGYPQVESCSRVTGDYSLLIEVLFRTTEEMDKFNMTLQHYGRTKTQIVFSTVIERRNAFLPDAPTGDPV